MNFENYPQVEDTGQVNQGSLSCESSYYSMEVMRRVSKRILQDSCRILLDTRRIASIE